ncbi:hypothetical protein X766_06200 [Mesorhizobium sp. LSJC255A00]|nr:hypothetical protein X766_06200 [Mesorhizobium sp. LSJC255A00]
MERLGAVLYRRPSPIPIDQLIFATAGPALASGNSAIDRRQCGTCKRQQHVFREELRIAAGPEEMFTHLRQGEVRHGHFAQPLGRLMQQRLDPDRARWSRNKVSQTPSLLPSCGNPRNWQAAAKIGAPNGLTNLYIRDR